MPLKPCRIAEEAEVSPGWKAGFGCGCMDTRLFGWCHGQGKAQGHKSSAKLAAVREDEQGGTMRVSNCREKVTPFRNITPDEHSSAV